MGREIERPRIFAERFTSVGFYIFVKIGHRELARGAIDRIAIAQYHMVGLANGTTQSVDSEQGKHMVLIRPHCAQIHKKRFLTVVRQRGGSEERAFKTMRRLGLQHAARRHVRLAAALIIYRKCVEIRLYLLRRRQLGKNFALGRGEEYPYFLLIHRTQYTKNGCPGERK